VNWRVELTSAAHRDLRRLPPDVALRLAAALERFGETGQGDLIKLQGQAEEWRLRAGDEIYGRPAGTLDSTKRLSGGISGTAHLQPRWLRADGRCPRRRCPESARTGTRQQSGQAGAPRNSGEFLLQQGQRALPAAHGQRWWWPWGGMRHKATAPGVNHCGRDQ
jgi:hypothetical protein